jgi:hypothetical protein
VPPEREASLVGYSALINHYELPVPLPEKLALVSRRHRRYDQDGWAVYTPRHMPEDSVAGHLAFALRYEGVDLAVLRALYLRIGGAEITDWVRREPVGRYARRAWFFYEWLTEQTLELSDARTGNFVKALDPKLYCVARAKPSRRHRVLDNLPGVRDFCPLVRRTERIEAYLASSSSTETIVKRRRVSSTKSSACSGGMTSLNGRAVMVAHTSASVCAAQADFRLWAAPASLRLAGQPEAGFMMRVPAPGTLR